MTPQTSPNLPAKWAVSRKPKSTKMEILKALGLSAALLVACLATASAEVLTPTEIEAEIIGQEFQGRVGIMRATIRYNEDGTVEMRAPIGRGSGTWQMAANGVCLDLTSGPRQGQECVTFTRVGDGTFEMSNGMQLVPQ